MMHNPVAGSKESCTASTHAALMAESTNESAVMLTNGDSVVHVPPVQSSSKASANRNKTTKSKPVKPRKMVRQILKQNDDEKATEKMNRKIVIQKKRFRLAYAPRNGVAMHPMENALIICKTPNRCQQKMRLLRKTLRRTAWNCVIAAGLECAACYNLHDLKNRSVRIRANSTVSTLLRDSQTQQSAPSETPKEATTVNSTNLQNGIPQSPGSSKPLDWAPHFPCIFCEHLPIPPPPKPKPKTPALPETAVVQRKEVVVAPPSDNLDWLRSLQLQLPSLNLGINMDGGSLSSAISNPFTPASPMQTSTLTASVWSKVNPFRFMPEEPVRPEEDEQQALTKPSPSTSNPDTPPLLPPPSKPSRSRGQGRQRRYTPSELRAAIDEVERGNVGTRKAALLYGIPRSTLRNKVGKLLTIKKPEDNEPGTAQPLVNGSSFSESPVVKEEGPVTPNKQDITFALKRIISRHLSDKYRAPAPAKARAEGKQKRSRNIDPANRHKRGRYRKYKQGDLEEALRLVKQGEMTVHRAGHLFGIPHSTLEYKIKERNGTLPHNPSVSSELEKPTKPVKTKKTAITEATNNETSSLPVTPTTPFLLDFPPVPADLNGSLLGLPPTPNIFFPNNPFRFGTGGEGNIFNQLLTLQLLQNSMMGLNALPPPAFSLFDGNPAPAGSAPFRPWAEGQEAGPAVIKEKKVRKRKMEDGPLNLTVSKDKAAKLVE